MTLTALYIPDMVCTQCANKIDRELRRDSNVEQVHAHPVKKLVFIKHNKHLSPLRLMETVEAIGFQPSLKNTKTASSDNSRRMLKRIGIAGIAMMQVMMLAVALYTGGIEDEYRGLLTITSLLFCLPVVFYSATPFFQGAYRAWIHSRRISMDTPVALAIAIAFTVSVYATITGVGEVYFDSVVMFTFFLLMARFINEQLKGQLSESTSVLSTLPQRCERVGDQGLTECDLDDLHPGDIVMVRQGDKLPTDGILVTDCAYIDEATLTGEADEVEKFAGDTIFAGTINCGASLRFKVTRQAANSRVAEIEALANQAALDRSKDVSQADTIAGFVLPGILILAGVTGIAWYWIEPIRALPAALAVLVVTCPCALSLATPAAMGAALTRLRRLGLVLTSESALDRAAAVSVVAFDKTGTLTNGKPRISQVEVMGSWDEKLCTNIAGTLEAHVNHPIARGFLQYTPKAVTNIHVHPGQGVSGQYLNTEVRIGSASFCKTALPDVALQNATLQNATLQNATLQNATLQNATPPSYRCIDLTWNGQHMARFTITEPLRADAASTLAGLKDRHINTALITGDSIDNCDNLELIDTRFCSQSPEQKLEALAGLQKDGAVVLAVGDGNNDLPMLAAADISATVLESSDYIRNRSELMLFTRSLKPIVEFIDTAKHTHQIINQNLVWAGAYNITMVPLAAFGLIPPWAAAVGMSVSSLVVMLNATRILRRG